jgi:hypothetical protein
MRGFLEHRIEVTATGHLNPYEFGSDLSPRPAVARRAPCLCPYGETVPDTFARQDG